ncbi:hypothetical protein H8959_014300 [Pygathrix nigripes]
MGTKGCQDTPVVLPPLSTRSSNPVKLSNGHVCCLANDLLPKHQSTSVYETTGCCCHCKLLGCRDSLRLGLHTPHNYTSLFQRWKPPPPSSGEPASNPENSSRSGWRLEFRKPGKGNSLTLVPSEDYYIVMMFNHYDDYNDDVSNQDSEKLGQN